MGFFSGLFRRSQKSENEYNDEYVEYLLEELEKARSEKNRTLEAQEELKKELETERAAKDEAIASAKADLEKQVEELKIALDSEDSKEEIAELQNKLREYESSYEEISRYIAQAKEDAEGIRTSAKTESDSLISSAKARSEEMIESARDNSRKLEAEARINADLYQARIEANLKKKISEREEKFTSAIYQFKEYLDAFNRIQNTLVKNYNELGQLIEKMPIKIEDLYSDEPFELLDDKQKNIIKIEDDLAEDIQETRCSEDI